MTRPSTEDDERPMFSDVGQETIPEQIVDGIILSLILLLFVWIFVA